MPRVYQDQYDYFLEDIYDLYVVYHSRTIISHIVKFIRYVIAIIIRFYLIKDNVKSYHSIHQTFNKITCQYKTYISCCIPKKLVLESLKVVVSVLSSSNFICGISLSMLSLSLLLFYLFIFHGLVMFFFFWLLFLQPQH